MATDRLNFGSISTSKQATEKDDRQTEGGTVVLSRLHRPHPSIAAMCPPGFYRPSTLAYRLVRAHLSSRAASRMVPAGPNSDDQLTPLPALGKLDEPDAVGDKSNRWTEILHNRKGNKIQRNTKSKNGAEKATDAVAASSTAAVDTAPVDAASPGT